MFDICLLGTGGMMPMPYRYLTSLMVRYNGYSILVDAGEGTQVAIKKKNWSFKHIDAICFTHFHADHISGLPGLLLTMGNSDRKDKLTIIGPVGIKRVCENLRIIAREIPFEIEYIEIEEDNYSFNYKDINIKAFKLAHQISCYGYSFKLSRRGKFNLKKAEDLEIPVEYWSTLQKGEQVVFEGKLFTSDMVMGKERKGIKIAYCTDTRPCENIIKYTKDCDLLVLEGMYGTDENANKAVQYKHMTMIEACEIASIVRPEELWLTHFSPSNVYPVEYKEELKKIFDNVFIPKDGWIKELKFKDE